MSGVPPSPLYRKIELAEIAPAGKTGDFGKLPQAREASALLAISRDLEPMSFEACNTVEFFGSSLIDVHWHCRPFTQASCHANARQRRQLRTRRALPKQRASELACQR